MRNLWTAIVLACAISFAAPAQAQPSSIYGVTEESHLLIIDPFTGAGHPIGTGTSIEPMESVEEDPSDPFSLLGIGNGNQLYRISKRTGERQLIGTISGSRVEALALGSGILYGARSVNGDVAAEQLVTINPTTGAATAIGSFGQPTDMEAMAYSPGGILYGANLNGLGLGEPRALYQINTATGAASAPVSLSANIAGLDFSSDGTLYGSTIPTIMGGASNLVTINPTTGAITTIGPIGYDLVDGLVVTQCGNGVVDPGEDCDDGNTIEDCCPADCLLPTSCDVAEKALLIVKNHTLDDERDGLTFKWKTTIPASLPYDDPRSTTDYRLCLYSGSASAWIELPAGSKWQAIQSGYKFQDQSGIPGGAERALLKRTSSGRRKITVRGKGVNLPDDLVPSLPLPVRAVVFNDKHQLCYEADFDTADVLRNDSQQFKARIR